MLSITDSWLYLLLSARNICASVRRRHRSFHLHKRHLVSSRSARGTNMRGEPSRIALALSCLMPSSCVSGWWSARTRYMLSYAMHCTVAREAECEHDADEDVRHHILLLERMSQCADILGIYSSLSRLFKRFFRTHTRVCDLRVTRGHRTTRHTSSHKILVSAPHTRHTRREPTAACLVSEPVSPYRRSTPPAFIQLFHPSASPERAHVSASMAHHTAAKVWWGNVSLVRGPECWTCSCCGRVVSTM